MSGFLFDPMMHGMRSVLDLRSQQHALTAANLANADTPGYKAQVLDFENALVDVMMGADTGMKHTDARHLGPTGPADAELIELEAPAWSTNDNSVLPEREHARMLENSLLYRGVAKGVGRKLALLKYAASDGKV